MSASSSTSLTAVESASFLPRPAIPVSVAEQAVGWLLQLQESHDCVATQEAWQRWLQADPVHAQAWQRIETINQRFHSPAQGDAVSDDSALQAQRHAYQAALQSMPQSAARRRATQALVLCVVVGASSWAALQTSPVQQRLAQLRTPRGGGLTRTLEEGTQIRLAGASAMNIHFDTNVRELELLQGQVWVQTGHRAGEQRPFRVRTPFGNVQALGTQYSVQLLDAGLDSNAMEGETATRTASALVAVFEGAVELRPSHSTANIILQAGEQAVFQAGAIGPVRTADPNRAAWAEGVIVASNMRLADFLTELAPHAPFLIDCAPEVAALRLSGSYPLHDVPTILESIAHLHQLQLETRQRFWGGQRVYLRPQNRT